MRTAWLVIYINTQAIGNPKDGCFKTIFGLFGSIRITLGTLGPFYALDGTLDHDITLHYFVW